MTEAEQELAALRVRLRALVEGWEGTREHYHQVYVDALTADQWSGGVADGLDMAIEELREELGDDTEHKP